MRDRAGIGLLQVSAAQMTEPGAVAAQIMWGKIIDASAVSSSFHHLPDRFRRNPGAPKFAHSIYPSENRARGDLGGCGPGVHRSFHPSRYWNRSDIPKMVPHPQRLLFEISLTSTTVLKLKNGKIVNRAASAALTPRSLTYQFYFPIDTTCNVAISRFTVSDI
jgi:hypothetical protein